MSDVHVPFEMQKYTTNTDSIGTLRRPGAIRFLGLENKTRIHQVSTLELYGTAQEVTQTEIMLFYSLSHRLSRKCCLLYYCKL